MIPRPKHSSSASPEYCASAAPQSVARLDRKQAVQVSDLSVGVFAVFLFKHGNPVRTYDTRHEPTFICALEAQQHLAADGRVAAYRERLESVCRGELVGDHWAYP